MYLSLLTSFSIVTGIAAKCNSLSGWMAPCSLWCRVQTVRDGSSVAWRLVSSLVMYTTLELSRSTEWDTLVLSTPNILLAHCNLSTSSGRYPFLSLVRIQCMHHNMNSRLRYVVAYSCFSSVQCTRLVPLLLLLIRAHREQLARPAMGLSSTYSNCWRLCRSESQSPAEHNRISVLLYVTLPGV